MEKSWNDLLTVLRHALHGEKADGLELNAGDWEPLRRLASEHYVLPMVADALYGTDAALRAPRQMSSMAARARRQAARQACHTADFLLLYEYLRGKGLEPVVMKGIVCRSLYPEPELRPSCDEDLLIDPAEIHEYHRAMLEYGLEPIGPEADIEDADEVSYRSIDKALYIELHKSPFPTDSPLFNEWNKHVIRPSGEGFHVNVYGMALHTLEPTSHLTYLVLHAFKHFIYSGIGVRAVSDIGMFAERYSEGLNWGYVRCCLEESHAFDFACALLHIAQQYFFPDAGFFKHIIDWNINNTDAMPLLEDILASGVHGDSSLERLHSSNITLKAFGQDKRAGTEGSSDRSACSVHAPAAPGFLSMAFHSVFLPYRQMSIRYSYLRGIPLLLPAAWMQRVLHYMKERMSARASGKDSTAGSIRLGRSRVELLKKYKVIK